jgi:hypothetical protein
MDASSDGTTTALSDADSEISGRLNADEEDEDDAE